MSRIDEQTNVRLPKELKDWLVEHAAGQRRSLTSALVMILEEARQRAKLGTSPRHLDAK